MTAHFLGANKYSAMSRFFHWVSAILLVVTWLMYVYGNIGLHKAFGLSLGAFMIARFIHRFFARIPQPVPMPTWQLIVSRLVHGLLYGLIIAQATAGFLMSMYADRPINYFGLFTIDVLVEPNKATAGLLNNLHTQIFWPMIWILTLLHVVGALYHHFIVKDGLIKRMM